MNTHFSLFDVLDHKIELKFTGRQEYLILP